MEAPLHQQLPPMPVSLMPPNCNHDATTTTAMAAATAAGDVACLQPLPASANALSGGREQCPRCASHDTKFCYYNNYNTSQPRHFCRACRRYWTLGGSLRNVPIGGSTRKRPRMAPPAVRRPPVHFGAPPSQHQGLLGSLFALGAAPLLEGRVGFDLGLGLPAGPGQVGHAGAAGEVGSLHGLGLRGGPAGTSAPLLWPTGLLENDNVDTWKLTGAGAGAIWPEFSATAAQAGGLLHGGAHML